MSKKLIAYLISDHQHEISSTAKLQNEFLILKPIFAKYGADLIETNWRDHSIRWQEFSIILPKACWNYAENIEEFKLFLKKIQTFQIPIKNNVDLILWNMRKNYLIDLQKLHLPITQSILVQQNQHIDISELTDKLQQFTSKILIAKSSIANGGENNICFDINEIKKYENFFRTIIQEADLIFQPFISEIKETGEYSYIFFNHIFSHAVLKKPAVNDYRAHLLFDATVTTYHPTDEEIQQATQFIANLNSKCQYARVDVFKRGNKLILVELELIEPYLFLENASLSSAHTFCKCILL